MSDPLPLLLWAVPLVLPLVVLVRCRRSGRPALLVAALITSFALFAGASLALHATPAASAAAAAGAVASVLGLARVLPRALATSDEDVEQLRLLRAAVEASADGVMVIAVAPGDSPVLRIVYANPAFASMTGYESSEALGKSPTMLRDPDADSPGLGAIRAALRGREAVRVEVPTRRKDGTRLWAEWHVVPVPGAAGGTGHWVAVLRDTTDRRRAQGELRQARDFLTSLLDNIPVPVHVADADDRLQLMNPAWEETVGASRELSGGHRIGRVLPRAVAEACARQNAAVRATGRPVREEVELDFGLGGGPRSFVTVSFPVRGPDGRAGAVGGVAIDVTEQARSAAALNAVNDACRQRVEELEAVIDLSPVGIAVAEDPACRRVRVNRALRELLALPPEASPDITLSPERLPVRLRRGGRDIPFDQSPMRQCVVRAEPVDGGEFEIVLRDGRTLTVVNSTRPLFDEAGRVRGCVSVFTDLTARVRAETALREGEELLRNVIAHIPGGVFWKDRESAFLGCNERVARDNGFSSPDEVVGRTDLELSADPAEAAYYRETDRRVMATGEPILNIEETQTRSNGTRATLLTSKVPLRDAAGAVVGVLGVYQDITDRKRLEDQLRQAQKMEAVGQLAGGIAHDFNNLLTIINGCAEILQDQVADSPESARLVAGVRDAGSRAAALTSQLLAFGRRSVLEPRVLDLSAAAAAAGDLVGRLIGEDIEFRIVPAAPAWTRVDPGHLDQVLLNLVLNARDAMPAGGTLTVRTATAEVTPEQALENPDARPGAYVVLTVADTGTGMTDEVKGRLFEPFFTTKELGKGTGLGLATVYGIVTQAGGHVRVTSAPGRGSEFAVYLPRVEPPARGRAAAPPESAVPRGTETVLLAEDETPIRKFVGSVLRSAGYTVIEAADGREALRVREQYPGRIDLLLTDVIMPHLGGSGLAAELAARDPDVRVLYISGYTNDAVVRAGVEDTAVAFLQKPFTPTGLTRKVREVLDAVETPPPGRGERTPPPRALAPA